MKSVEVYRKTQVMPTMRRIARKYIILRKLDEQLKNEYLDVDMGDMLSKSLNSVNLVEKDLKAFEKRLREFIKGI